VWGAVVPTLVWVLWGGEGLSQAGCGPGGGGGGCGRVRGKDDEVSSSVSVRFPRVYSSSRKRSVASVRVQGG
jgi:hypothetical protein